MSAVSFETQLAHARRLWQQDEVAACEALLRDLLARDAAHEDATFLLAKLLQTQGRLDAACALVFHWCGPGDFALRASARAAEFMRECQRQTLADDVCEAALARQPASAEFLALAGHVAREVGDFERARSRYLAALDAGVDLDASYVLGALANTLRYEDASHPDFTRLRAHFRDGRALRARAASGFGLAKAYDDIGDRETAARVLYEANAMVRSVQPWLSADWRQFVARRKHEQIACTRNAELADFAPVFVLGMPRSGTTLTATRLAQHAHARDRGELRTLRFIAQQLIDGDHLADVNAIEEAAALYYAHARQDDKAATWYIDQDPLNFRYIHLIAAMFPQARIVLCQRDRRDTALSQWSQDFAHADCAFAYDFADIGAYAAGFDELIAHWQRTLALPIHVAHYEELVADPPRALSALRTFLGMAGDEVTDTVAAINTSSIWQARQPIYTRSVGRWRAYAPFIPEVSQFGGAG